MKLQIDCNEKDKDKIEMWSSKDSINVSQVSSSMAMLLC
jgi:hypothetical protein